MSTTGSTNMTRKSIENTVRWLEFFVILFNEELTRLYKP